MKLKWFLFTMGICIVIVVVLFVRYKQQHRQSNHSLNFVYASIDPIGDNYGKILVIKYSGSEGVDLYFAEPNKPEVLLISKPGSQQTGFNSLFIYFEKNKNNIIAEKQRDKKQILQLPVAIYDDLLAKVGNLILKDSNNNSATCKLRAN